MGRGSRSRRLPDRLDDAEIISSLLRPFPKAEVLEGKPRTKEDGKGVPTLPLVNLLGRLVAFQSFRESFPAASSEILPSSEVSEDRACGHGKAEQGMREYYRQRSDAGARQIETASQFLDLIQVGTVGI